MHACMYGWMDGCMHVCSVLFCSVLSCALCTRVASAAAHLPKTAFKVKQAKTRGETISSKSRDEHKQNKLHEKG